MAECRREYADDGLNTTEDEIIETILNQNSNEEGNEDDDDIDDSVSNRPTYQ